MSSADVENVEQVEEERILEPEYYYPEDHVEKVLEDSPITTNLLEYYQGFGFDSNKRYNLNLIDDSHIIYISGASFYIFNIDTREKKVFFSRDGAGIGSIAVHPSKQYFAVAEKGNFPNIYIYEFPSLRLKRILRKGTERSYSNVCFSISGDKLASVGSSPDYQICVWDWMTERILLKAKAFSQEVYKVSFSNYNDDILATSGTGHIKFWKIAETFTGLKLKGEIAKFGQIELSDVTSFFTFPDEKVISSTEYGKLLLWEGNIIKAVVAIDAETPCHKGAIESIFLDTLPGAEGEEDKRYIVTAGTDGCIKFWDFDELDQAEGDDHFNYYIQPSKVIELKDSNDKMSSILTIERASNFWLVYDINGIIWRLSLPDFEQRIVMETNAGKMMDLCLSNHVNAAVSVGEDGAVRLWDYVNKKETYGRAFRGKGTALEWAPKNSSNKGRVLYAGYSSGIMRVVHLHQTGVTLLRSMKVHSESLYKIKVSPSGQILVVATRSGSLFFLEINPQKPQDLEPFCLIELGIQINDLCWNEDSRRLLLACEDGQVIELTVPEKDECVTTETYLKDLSEVRLRSYTIRMMESQKPKHDEMEDLLLGWKDHKALKEKQDEEWEPSPILSCTYVDAEGSQFICSVDGKFQGFYYICSFDQERPIIGITAPKIPSRSLRFFGGYTILVASLDDGTFLIKRKDNWEAHLVKLAHDRDYGVIRRVEFSHDNTMCLTCSEDGTLNAYKMDLAGIRSAANEQEFEISFPETAGPIPDHFWDGEVELSMPVEEDILDDNIYSIQEDKLNTEEDNKKTLAEKKKEKVLQQVKLLQKKFEELLSKNKGNENSFRLTDDELVVDPQYQEILENEISDILEETRKELSWDLAYNEMRANKLKQYFLDELHTERICLKSFDAKHKVTTFKVKNLTPYIQNKLDEINIEIEEENKLQAEESSPGGLRDATMNFDGDSTSNFDRNRNQHSRSIIKLQTDKFGETPNARGFGKQKTLLAEQNNIKLSNTFGAGGGNVTNAGATVLNPNATMNATLPAAQTSGGYQKYDRERAKKEEAERLAIKEELEKSMPTYEAFQPDHLKAINLEMERLGDFKLKSSKDYIVPEDQRMNVEKKRKHIFLLYEVLYRSKKDFNEKILELRKKKTDIISKISKHNERLKDIDKELGVEEEYISASIDPVLETPEKYYEISDDVLDEYTKKKDQEKANAAAKGGFFGGAGAPSGAAMQTVSSGASLATGAQDAKKDDKLAQAKGNLVPIQTRDRKTKKVEESALEREIRLANEMRLTSEKEDLKAELDADIKSFDKQIIKLQEEKAVLEWNMKVVEMKLITFSQELIILEDMQEHDDQLISKLLNARKDKSSFESQNADYAAQILEKKQNHFNVDKKLNETINEYNKYFLDDINRANKIFAYFQRMHKKRKNKEMNKKKDDEDGEDEGESDEDDDSFDEEEDEEEKVDVSPVMNDPNLRKLVDTRNELLDEKSQLEEDMNKLQNERRIIDNRLGQIDELIKNTEADLRDYQRQKLQRVNKLIVAHFLKLSQIQNLIKYTNQNGEECYQMPQDLGNGILFTEKALNRLHNRISELDIEKQEVFRQNEKLSKEKKKLDREIKEKNKDCDEARKRYQEEHMLKFGDVIDFSVLDSLVPTKEVLQKREDFKKEEREAEKRVEEAQHKYLLAKKRLFEEKKENTRILNKITALGQKKMDLDKNLDSNDKAIFEEGQEDKKTNLDKEKSHLVELVRFLAKEIEDLKTEIALFKKKGGHIYTMVTSNKKTLEDII